MLSRDILSRPIRTERISIPEWGTDTFVRVMSGRDRHTFQSKLKELDQSLFSALFFIACVCDEQGQRQFAWEDLEQVANLEYDVLERVALAAIKLNKLDEDSTSELKKS